MENILYRKKTARNTKSGVDKGKSPIMSKDCYENEAWKNQQLVCGIDEVGRGCLAGPIVAAAVILRQKRSALLKDSKLLNHQQLRDGYGWIIENSWYSIGIINNDGIDQFNIYQATLMAMNKAVIHLCAICPDLPVNILIDAMPLKLAHTAYGHIPIHHFPKGEQYSTSIAAASIVAKVTRDRLMDRFTNLFPGYHFDKHKGYGTKKHQAAILEHGRSLLHRVTFLHGELGDGCDSKGQQTLF